MEKPEHEKEVDLFGEEIKEEWEGQWQGMPEFKHEEQASWKAVIVHFDNAEDLKKFSELVGQKVLFTTKSIWYPKQSIKHVAHLRYTDEP
jgi:hypothetical protein